MSERAETPDDPVIQRLRRFSVQPAGIDAAEILFEAGRASARRGLFWPLAAGVLLCTQVVTAIFLAQPSAPIVVQVPVTVIQAAEHSSSLDPDSGLQNSRQNVVQTWLPRDTMTQLPPPLSAEQMVSSDPPLSIATVHGRGSFPE